MGIHYLGARDVLSEIIQYLEKGNLENVEYIYIMPLQQLLKEFEDEMVSLRLIEEKSLAMNRGLADYPDVPREILVTIDHPSLEIHLKNLRRKGWTEEEIKREKVKQIIISIFHEEGHLKGLENEKNAEEYAQNKFYTIHIN